LPTMTTETSSLFHAMVFDTHGYLRASDVLFLNKNYLNIDRNWVMTPAPDTVQSLHKLRFPLFQTHQNPGDFARPDPPINCRVYNRPVSEILRLFCASTYSKTPC
jgi:hypothetical protein